MSKKDTWREIGSAAAGIVGGLALAELLKNLLQKRCRACNNLNENNRINCKYCGMRLE